MRKRDINKEIAIREAALKMVGKEGLEGLSMQKLAAKARVSPATIYLYFENREDLILKLFSDLNQKMVQVMLDGFDPEMPFAEGLKIQWRNRAKYCLENPDHIYFLDQIHYSPLLQKAYANMDRNFIEKMVRFVNNAVERKELAKVYREVYWSIAFAPLYQMLKFHMQGFSLAGEQFTLTDEHIDQLLGLVIKALKP